MKRRLFKLALFLILGAVVNVAVAWGCVLKDYKLHSEGFLATEDVTRWWDAHVPENYPGSPVKASDYRTFGVSGSVIWTQREFHNHVSRLRAGFPVRALERSSWFDYNKEKTRLLERHQLIVFEDRQPVPLSPIWPGFAINTMFYAALLWLLTLGPFTARRMIRRKRGRCIKCGYDLRHVEHEKCPECGKDLCEKGNS